MRKTLSFVALVAAFPAFAETRQLDAHEHGVGALNIAIDGTTVAMTFQAPGADIVGFEYAGESNADLAAIDAAIDALEQPLGLFAVSPAAGCSVTSAHAELESDDDHDDHADDGHDDHGHDDHADEDHSDHGHEDHDDHADETGHTEFHADYTLTCDDPDALTQITFGYFATFPNAIEVEVQIVSASGAQAFEVARDAPVLNLDR